MPSRFLRYWNEMNAVRRRHGKSLSRQVKEIVDLRLSGPRLGASEYYAFALYREPYTRAQLREFGGWRLINWIAHNVINFTWCVFTGDKVVFNLYASSIGVPIAETLLVITKSQRNTGNIPNATDIAQIESFLADGGVYPLFVKPIHSSYGKGALRLDGFDPETDTISVYDGHNRTRRDVARELMRFAGSRRFRGCIVQRVLLPHPELLALCGPTLSGLRVGVARGRAGPEIYRAALKINRGGQLTDNFEHGTSGNLLGDIDITTGTLQRVVSGTGLDLREIEQHPSTGKALPGFRIPDWERITEVALTLATALPELPILGVDIAPTDRGPVVLEINTPGDFDLLQLAARRGVLAEPAVRHLVRPNPVP